MLSIQINDTGQPIPEDEIATIFHPFVTNKTSGSGVGWHWQDGLSKVILEPLVYLSLHP